MLTTSPVRAICLPERRTRHDRRFRAADGEQMMAWTTPSEVKEEEGNCPGSKLVEIATASCGSILICRMPGLGSWRFAPLQAPRWWTFNLVFMCLLTFVASHCPRPPLFLSVSMHSSFHKICESLSATLCCPYACLLPPGDLRTIN